MERKSRAIILMMLLLMLSIPTMAFRKLTTTQIRENSIRINALELDEINNNIETFHKTNEALEKMEERLEGIQSKMK